MLTISEGASEAIRRLVESADLPDSAGLRIAAGDTTEQGTPLELALVESPGADDEVVADSGAAVFLEPEIAPALEDVILDAQISDDEVAFVIREQALQPPPATNGASPA
jgi:Fe-S cluster assembly iron-binding protein IscA